MLYLRLSIVLWLVLNPVFLFAAVTIQQLETGLPHAEIRKLAADGAGRVLVSSDGTATLRVWDALSGRLIDAMHFPTQGGLDTEISTLAMSPDGKTLAIAPRVIATVPFPRTEIVIVPRTMGRALRRIPVGAETVSHLRFSDSGNELLIGTRSGKLFGYDVAQNVLTEHHLNVQASIVDLDTDGVGHVALLLSNKTVLLLDEKRSWLRSTSIIQDHEATQVRLSPDGKLVALSFRGVPRISVYSTQDLRFLYAPSVEGVTSGDLRHVSFSIGGGSLVAVGSAVRQGRAILRRWPAQGRGTPQDTLLPTSYITAAIPLPQDSTAVGTSGTLLVLAANGNPIVRVHSSLANWKQRVLATDHAGLRVALTTESLPDGTGPLSLHFSVNEHVLTRATMADASLRQASAAIQPGSIEQLRLPDDESVTCSAGSNQPARFLIGTTQAVRMFDERGAVVWTASTKSPVRAVVASGNGRLVIATLSNGTVQWFSASTGTRLLTLAVSARDMKWIASTPSGYFDASVGGDEMLGWTVQHREDRLLDFVPAKLLAEHRYRPDVTARVLITQSEDLAIDEANLLQSRERGLGSSVSRTELPLVQILPPVVTILDPQDGLGVRQGKVRLRVAVRSLSGEVVAGLRAMVQGRQTQSRDVVLEKLPQAQHLKLDDEQVQQIDIVIPTENTTVAVQAMTPHARSEPQLLHLRWLGQSVLDKRPSRNLYVLSVGLSRYQQSSLNLEYAAKDAQDLAVALQAQQRTEYDRVQSRLLLDQTATRANILSGLAWLRQVTTQRDIAVLFLAGHGTTDPTSGRYYFLPFDANTAAPGDTMLDARDIQGSLSAVRGNVLLFVDTCHSGSVFGRAESGERSMGRLLSELSSVETGVVVYAASTGSQISRESSRWGNGAFTRALLEGLRGKADPRHTGRITVSSLEYYVSERVRELTDNQQTPTTAKPNTVPDLRIASVQPPSYLRPGFWVATSLGAFGVAALVTGLAVGLTQDPQVPGGTHTIGFPVPY